MIKLIICSLIVALTGCSAAGSHNNVAELESIRPIIVNDAELKILFERGAERVQTATGLNIPIVESFDDPNSVNVVRSIPDGDFKWTGSFHFEATKNDDGLYEIERTITIDGDCPADTVETVVLHEMLHSIGVKHVKFDQCVMSPLFIGFIPLTENDLNAICAVRDCTNFQTEI